MSLIFNQTYLLRARFAGLAVLVACSTVATAFPPAPFHTLYGMVRDENGRTLRVDGARVVFYRDGAQFLSETISESTQLDQNYQIRLRMDMLRSGTQAYSSLANATGTSFTLGVVLHDTVYYPIEMSSPRAVGKPGERIRLDLTLGVDADGDGIPDAWEQSQLYAAGILPGDNGWDLSLIDRDGDFDNDGVSNWNEYIAGTFATDPTDHLSLRISAKFPESVRLSFFSLYGKTYSLETSTDLKTWTAAPLYLSNPAPDNNSIDDPETSSTPELPSDNYQADKPPAAQTGLRAEATDTAHIYAPAPPAGSTFYRLKVR